MQVRQLIYISGTIDGVRWPGIGETIDLAPHVCESMIASGFVEAVAPTSKREIAAAAPTVETAAVKPATRRTPKA
jgi:hypothetical protein